jgi:hypothetical protein
MNSPGSVSTSLRLARWLLLALVAASLLALGASLLLAPAYVPSHLSEFDLSDAWTPELLQAALVELGWRPTAVAWFEFARSLVLTFGTLIPGVLILRRKSHDWFGLYAAFAFIVVPAWTNIQPLSEALPVLRSVDELAGSIAWQLYFVLFYVFPDGKFVPRWTRWLLLLWVGLNLMPGAFSESSASVLFQRLPFLYYLPYALVFIAIGSQIYRYFWVSNAVQRQQTRWVVLALFATMLTLGWLGSARALPAPERQPLGQSLVLELGRLVTINLGFTVVPIAIAIAILRSKLWDVDLIIRRTLIYSVLTGLLALAYFGSVLLLQSAFGGLTGNADTPLVTVLSTLASAALFLPLRSRVQGFIDRRFYRRKYDTARTLAAFAATARDETDLVKLAAQLQQVVDETMQPAATSLWLRRVEQPGGRHLEQST